MNTLNTSVNPFKQIRNDVHWSQYRLASEAGVSKHAVLRLEQGMYADPLPKLLNFFVSEFNVSRGYLLKSYSDFQKAQRSKAGLIFGEDLDQLFWEWANNPKAQDWGSPYHPLIYLRLSAKPPLNPTQLAKALCISQTVVTYFEKHPISQKTVPTQLLTALSDAGYTSTDLIALATAYAHYRDFVLTARSVSHGA